MKTALSFLLLTAISVTLPVRASMVSPLNTEASLRAADAACRGFVLETTSYQSPADGGIYTRARVRVDEVFKGRLPAEVTVVQRGGRVGHRGETVGCSVALRTGERRTLFLTRRADGSLVALHGTPDPFASEDQALRELRAQSGQTRTLGADVTDQAWVPQDSPTSSAILAAASPSSVTNLLTNGFGVSSRFIAPDAGDPIPYLVDADALPSGMTMNQAMAAVQTALAAWTAATGVQFAFEGTQSFGTTAANAGANDGKLRIQLHDLYGFIPEPQVLGKGGRTAFSIGANVGGWGYGGRVAGSEFDRTGRGYVVMKHTDSLLANTNTFAEVLCHEVGHALSMDHSSEDPNENWPDWREAIMYYLAHADGRGATLGAYDTRVVQQVLPIANTPPKSYDRVMDIVTQSSGAPNVAGINEVEVRGYDLQSTDLTLQTTGSSTDEFSVVGGRIKHTPAAPWNEPRLDPAGNSFYDVIYLRHSDGTNASAYASVRTLSFMPDNSPSDGMPNAWMTTYFGNTSGTGPRAPNADFDNDGMTNLREFILGSDPTSATSNLRILSVSPAQIQFQAKPYELYEIHGSTDLMTWTRVVSPVIPTTATGVAAGYSNAAPAFQALRVLKVQ